MYQGEEKAGYGTNYYTNVQDAEMDGGPLPSVWPLKSIATGDDKKALLDAIQNLSSIEVNAAGEVVGSAAPTEFNRAAWKRSALAAEMAGLMLDPSHNAIFGGEMPAAFGDPAAKKILIMMTDSANLGCCFTNYPSGNFRGHYIYSYSPDHTLLVDDKTGVCKQLKEAGVEIFTVLLDVNPDDMDTGGEQIVNAFQKNCATDASHAFTVGGSPEQQEEQLKNAYSTIGRAIRKLKLSQ
jgi:hypothetical protein